MPDERDDPWGTIPTPPIDGAVPATGAPLTAPLPDAAVTPTWSHESPPTRCPPPAPPGFEILGELGRGGMGVVYHARQTKLKREVALKMILTGGHSSAEDRVRFLAEAEAIAALNHPGIVQVYEFGTHAGQPYFALEYCPGGSLAKRLDGTPLPARDAASLVQKVAYAVHAAHEKGIVHRDLKPANVLMTRTVSTEDAENVEKQAEAGLSSAYTAISAVKVSDFGLAKRLESGSDLTKSGAVMGTPSYMAPEQARGEGKQLRPATDVYALGAILYELLTGRPPFRAANPFDTMLQVVNEDPVPVRQLQKKVPTDLETICHKCLHKEPSRRYGSAKDLARDLGRWMKGESIQARPVGQVERAWRWCRRKPAVAGLAAAVMASLTAGIAVSANFALNARRQAIAAKESADRLKQVLDQINNCRRRA